MNFSVHPEVFGPLRFCEHIVNKALLTLKNQQMLFCKKVEL